MESLEMHVRNTMHKMGCVVLERLLNSEVGVDEKEEIECDCGKKARFIEIREKKVETVVGRIHLRYAYYYDRECGHGISPRERELGVERSSFSPGVQRMMARIGSSVAYGQAEEDLRELAGLDTNAKAIERICKELEGEANRFMSEKAQKAEEARGTTYVSMDGTGVPVVEAETEGRKGKGVDGEAKTREAKLGCVFTQTRQDEEGYPVRDQNSTTYIGAIESAEEFGKSIYWEAHRRGVEKSTRVCVIGDGAPWIWNIAQEHFWSAIQIVDLYHAREHYWTIARLMFKERSGRMWRWTNKRMEELDRGDVEAVIRALKRLNPKAEATRRELSRTIRYYEQNRERMRYDKFRALGLFVGSGVIEAGCRSIVGQRLKQSGMHWSVKGANSVIALRCILLSHRWDDFWAFKAAA